MAGPYTTFTGPDTSYQSPVLYDPLGPLTQTYPWWMQFTFGGGIVGVAYSEDFSLGGNFPLAVTVSSGSLPTGLSLSALGSTPGNAFRLAGTPAVAGTFTFVLRVTNTAGFMDHHFSIVVAPGTATGGPYWPAFTFPNGVLNVAYAEQFTPAGASPVAVTLTSGSLPTGLSLSNVSGSTYQISGTPTAAGTSTFTLHASNTYGTADATFSITIVAAAGGGAWTFVS